MKLLFALGSFTSADADNTQVDKATYAWASKACVWVDQAPALAEEDPAWAEEASIWPEEEEEEKVTPWVEETPAEADAGKTQVDKPTYAWQMKPWWLNGRCFGSFPRKKTEMFALHTRFLSI